MTSAYYKFQFDSFCTWTIQFVQTSSVTVLLPSKGHWFGNQDQRSSSHQSDIQQFSAQLRGINSVTSSNYKKLPRSFHK